MQGQRGTIGSLPETLSFDHGSTSNSTVDQQICWNNMRNPAETRLPEYMLSPTGTNVTFMNPLSNERPALSSWSLGEPSSSGPQNEVAPRDERKTELGWAALNPYGAPASRSEEPQRERTNSLHVDSSNLNFVQSSNSNMMPTSINLNAGYASHDGNIGCSNAFKSGAAESQVIPPGSSSESLHLPSGSGGYLVEESDSRLGCPYEGRRASSKRKALEQSSLDANCSYFQHGESNLWPNGSVCYDGGNSLSISTPSEQRNSGLVLGVRETTTERIPNLYAAGNAESSRRNLRVRINPSSQQESVPPTLSGVARHPNGLSTHLSSRLLPNEQPLDSRSAPTVDNPASLSQPVVMQVPTLPRNAQPFRWERGSSSRNGSSSNTNFPRDRDAFSREETSVFPREETRSRSSMARQLLENPLFTQDLRNVVRSSTSRSLAGGNVSVPGNVASSSRTGSSSGVTRSSAPSWASHPNVPSHYPRRFSEFVRRSLISSLGSESGGQSSNPTQLHAPSPEEIMLMSGTANQGHHQHHSYPRPSSWLERQGDGVIGFPHPLRTLASGEGRSRLVVSEQIRNVLDLMRRGENLRFEDVMILDQSVFFGVADVHDRHRDMRLDVDNMSYEELLALEERIGNVSTGVSEETIMNRLKLRKYTLAVGSGQQETEPCCVCQEEYAEEEEVGTLECGHEFHSHCIKQWLLLKNICPICKTTALSK